MKLSTFVASLAWTSIFIETWLWLLGSVYMDGLRSTLYVLFWILALLSGAWSLSYRQKPR